MEVSKKKVKNYYNQFDMMEVVFYGNVRDAMRYISVKPKVDARWFLQTLIIIVVTCLL